MRLSKTWPLILLLAGVTFGQAYNPGRLTVVTTPWSRTWLTHPDDATALSDLGFSATMQGIVGEAPAANDSLWWDGAAWQNLTTSALTRSLLDDATTLAAAGTLQQDQLIDIRWHGAVSGGGDDTAAITAAFAAAMASGGIVFFPPGTWHITGGLTTTLTGDLGILAAPGAVLDYTGGEFIFTGNQDDGAITLGAAVARKATSVQVDDTSLMHAGDLLYIDTDVVAEGSWNTHKMEVHEIQAITDGTHFELAEPLVFSYDPGDTGLVIRGYHRAKLCVDGLTMTHSANQWQVHYTIGTTVRNVRLINTTAGGNNCLFTQNVNGLWDGVRMSGATYGVSQGCNRNTIFRNIYVRDTAGHPIATSMWSYYTLVDGLMAQKVAGVCDAHPSFETHYRNVLGYDVGFGNLRGIGGSLVHARIFSANNWSTVAYMANVLLSVDTAYHDEQNLLLDDIEIDAPSVDANDANSRFSFSYGRRVTINNFSERCRGNKGGGYFDLWASTAPTGTEEVTISNSRLFKVVVGSENVNITNCRFESAIDANTADNYALKAGTARSLLVSNCDFTDFNAVILYNGLTAHTPFTGCQFFDCNNLADVHSGQSNLVLSGCHLDDLKNYMRTNDAAVLNGVHASNCVTSGITPALLTGTLTWNPANLVDGAGETSAGITVTGAALGDYVEVSAPYDLQDCTVNAYVQAANTVEIRLQNESTGARDLASGSWSVRVVRK